MSWGRWSWPGCRTVGWRGSKRVLSPAGSLELTMETQQQKRVKEEEASKVDEKFELVKPCSVVLSSTEDSKRSEKSYLGSQGQGRRELETLSSLSSDPSDPKEIPPLPQPSLPHVTASGSEALKEYAQPSGKPHRRGLLPSSVKKEDSKEQADLPPLAPPSSQPLSETSHSNNPLHFSPCLTLPPQHFLLGFSCLCNPSSPFSSPVKWKATCPRSKLAWPHWQQEPLASPPAQSTAVTSSCPLWLPHPAAQHPHQPLHWPCLPVQTPWCL